MGIASILAVILVVLKATGFTALAWGWCLAGFGFDIALAVVMLTLGYFFSKKAVKAVNNTDIVDRINAAKDRLG
jgi:hypothetical protein